MSSTPKSKAIFITSESPFPPNRGAKIRDFHLIRLLAERFDVQVLCFKTPGPHDAPPPGVTVQEIERLKAPLWRRSLYPLRPYIVNGFCPRMEEAIRSHAAPGRLLWVSRLALAQYIPGARKLGYRIVLDEHNVESDLLMTSAISSLRNLPYLWIAAQCSYYEGAFCKQSDAVVATSDSDAAKLSKLVGKVPVHVVPNTIDSDRFELIRNREGNTLFFSGTLNYGPNVEGLLWFVEEVLPRLRRSQGEKLPRIVVAGSDPSAELLATLSTSGIEVRANPETMLPLLAEAAVVFVPLRSGSGTRLKILEAMAAGRAVVSTGKGAEGLILSPTYDIWIADDPDRFTSALIHLLEDAETRRTMGGHAADTIRSRYDWKCGRAQLDTVLRGLSVSG